TVRHRRYASARIGNERDIWVYTPPGFIDAGDQYPLLVLFDGETFITAGTTPTILDNLVADGTIPPCVAVLVGNADGARARELPCYPPFVEFLTDELLPWVQQEYHATSDPAHV